MMGRQKGRALAALHAFSGAAQHRHTPPHDTSCPDHEACDGLKITDTFVRTLIIEAGWQK